MYSPAQGLALKIFKGEANYNKLKTSEHCRQKEGLCHWPSTSLTTTSEVAKFSLNAPGLEISLLACLVTESQKSVGVYRY